MAVVSTNIHWHAGDVSREERWAMLGGKGCTLWFTGEKKRESCEREGG